MTLVEFLTARLDEDEAAARTADWAPRWVMDHDLPNAQTDIRQHIIRHDPARVLREVAAKRAIVAALVAVKERRAHDDPLGLAHDSGAEGQEYTLEWACHHLAAVYADAPGYDEAWRP